MATFLLVFKMPATVMKFISYLIKFDLNWLRIRILKLSNHSSFDTLPLFPPIQHQHFSDLKSNLID